MLEIFRNMFKGLHKSPKLWILWWYILLSWTSHRTIKRKEGSHMWFQMPPGSWPASLIRRRLTPWPSIALLRVFVLVQSNTPHYSRSRAFGVARILLKPRISILWEPKGSLYYFILPVRVLHTHFLNSELPQATRPSFQKITCVGVNYR